MKRIIVWLIGIMFFFLTCIYAQEDKVINKIYINNHYPYQVQQNQIQQTKTSSEEKKKRILGVTCDDVKRYEKEHPRVTMIMFLLVTFLAFMLGRYYSEVDK